MQQHIYTDPYNDDLDTNSLTHKFQVHYTYIRFFLTTYIPWLQLIKYVLVPVSMCAGVQVCMHVCVCVCMCVFVCVYPHTMWYECWHVYSPYISPTSRPDLPSLPAQTYAYIYAHLHTLKFRLQSMMKWLLHTHITTVNYYDIISGCPSNCTDPCSLPPETGRCRASIPRYYHNSESGQCEMFTYGGCEGNQNRFTTKAECEKACKGMHVNEISMRYHTMTENCHGRKILYLNFFHTPRTTFTDKINFSGFSHENPNHTCN